ncbi:hypothetical protein, conserved [Babesia bigemina]|uniref:Methyltransferase small domain-containing protein n=1 Tax=Babesia bigemina TaxID=5866 RepID=A0A061D5Q1_BABBI|nr:hypothetical protein, conserved [Babesia bigemina]CDR95327.1 hypothetical protein, conserved [Babesia bigemina]|eukprot:XP_012767513.1 hypothetical protein, conserved [Babesia bigemina]
MAANVGRINVDYAHVEIGEFKDTVYCPCQDTFLFVDALQSDIEHLRRREIAVVMEIGSGSGYISAYLLKLLCDNGETGAVRATHRRDDGYYQCAEGAYDVERSVCAPSCKYSPPFVIAVDINPFANAATMQTLNSNGVAEKADAVGMDMFASLNCRASRKMVDVVMFNPPYVPSDGDETANECLDMAWNGGAMGREVTDRFIGSVKVRLLHLRNADTCNAGILIAQRNSLVEKRNDVNSVLQFIEKQGFDAQVIITKKLLGETLSVIRFCTKNTDALATQRQ